MWLILCFSLPDVEKYSGVELLSTSHDHSRCLALIQRFSLLAGRVPEPEATLQIQYTRSHPNPASNSGPLTRRFWGLSSEF
jgi:hypothetical protein